MAPSSVGNRLSLLRISTAAGPESPPAKTPSEVSSTSPPRFFSAWWHGKHLWAKVVERVGQSEGDADWPKAVSRQEITNSNAKKNGDFTEANPRKVNGFGKWVSNAIVRELPKSWKGEISSVCPLFQIMENSHSRQSSLGFHSIPLRKPQIRPLAPKTR